jgi:hypothetical protein
MGGFDLTQFGVRPQQSNRQQQPVQQVSPVPATPASVHTDPDGPVTLDEALRKPIHGEAGFQDRLAKGDPMLKHDLWSIDKFVEPGGLPKDKSGNILIKAPPSTEDDRKEINHHE